MEVCKDGPERNGSDLWCRKNSDCSIVRIDNLNVTVNKWFRNLWQQQFYLPPANLPHFDCSLHLLNTDFPSPKILLCVVQQQQGLFNIPESVRNWHDAESVHVMGRQNISTGLECHSVTSPYT